MTYKYSVNKDWTTQHIPSWKKILQRVDPQQPLTFMEVGCFEGRSTTWFIDNYLHHPDSRIFCIDTWAGGEEVGRLNLPFDFNIIKQNFLHNIINSAYPSKTVVMQSRSDFALISLNYIYQPCIDVAYIDGSHTAKDVLYDITLAYRLLKPKGIMIFDDYKNQMATNDTKLRVRSSIDYFVSTLGDEVKFSRTSTHQAYLVKRR